MSFAHEALICAAGRRGDHTTADMARRLGVPYLTVYRWVTGRNTPGPAGLAAIERTYGLTAAALFSRTAAA
ncbi:helix-turn-helix domain-containing protein [Streptomyces sp. 3211]|uniref:helix-turn-helix domain-containing protein n=1 Tax=Streptomyces sp. 3211 TaxID=1964449 RepID=UPI001331394E|nr:helix-turn-helix transcriptional regulator [Streptomyces sp. 3211]